MKFPTDLRLKFFNLQISWKQCKIMVITLAADYSLADTNIFLSLAVCGIDLGYN